jgi:long-chain acyl-CoA synthetase
MYFWEIDPNKEKVAVVDSLRGELSYSELVSRIEEMKGHIPANQRKQLGLILCQNNIDTLVAYLAGLQLLDAVMLLDQNLDLSLLDSVIDQYQPDWIITLSDTIDFSNYERNEKKDFVVLVRKESNAESEINPNLALLLSTSGTTGSSKFVRLSYQNLQSNASAIAQYLDLSCNERAITTLPIQYSYGLSVINSHLSVGATLLLTNESIMSKDFWPFFKAHEATSFAGVPYTYHMLHRLRFEKMDLPSLRSFTQAGGSLSLKYVHYFNKVARERNLKFYIMYGQTEATARISYVPPKLLAEKPESIGIPVPGGKLSLDPETSELIYEGPNVMMGYANERSDLFKGDEHKRMLHTGDIGSVDDDGYFYIKGRKKRFIKLFGLRLNLDDIEKRIEAQLSISVACTGDDTKLLVFIVDKESQEEVEKMIRETYKIHHTAFGIKKISEIPRLENGKINYTRLKDM